MVVVSHHFSAVRLTVLVKCVRWGADVILTDVTKKWLDLRAALTGTVHEVFPYQWRSISTILSRL